MKKLTAIAIVATCLVAYQAQATIVINMAVGNLQDQNGVVTPAPAIALLVSDTSGLGYAGGISNLAANSSLTLGSDLTIQGGGTGDQIIGKWVIAAGSGANGLLSDSTSFTLAAPLATAQNLYLLWFPTLTSSSSTPGNGTHYGGYQASALESAAVLGQPWLMPADGANITLGALTPANGGITAQSSLNASFATVSVPEPSSIALVVIGLFGAVGIVRRRRS